MPISQVFEKLRLEHDRLGIELGKPKEDRVLCDDEVLKFLEEIRINAPHLTNIEDRSECAYFVRLWNSYLPDEKRVNFFIYDLYPKDGLTTRGEL